jgi:rhamnogalacturonan endolyase
VPVFVSVALAATTQRANAAQVAAAHIAAKPAVNAPVTVTDNGRTWTLDNGIVKVTIDKRNGGMDSLIYKGIDTLGHEQGQPGVWEEDPSAAADTDGLTDSLTIDPAKNGGERAEVSVKGVTGGQFQLARSAPGGGTYCDIEIRYAMGRGDSGVYAYAIYTHPAAYRATGVGSENRYITKLNQTFDWISVDADRNMLECAPTDWGTGVVVHAKEQRILTKGVYKNSVEHKYSYAGVQSKTPAYGWSSTRNHIGIWFINPTIEYLTGGPTKLELDCHFGDDDNSDPIILDYWEGGHYDGGSTAHIGAGENWSRVVGPIFIYVNSLQKFKTPSKGDLAKLTATAGNPTIPPAWTDNANALFNDALAQAKKQTAQWPYNWVNGVDYPHKDQRGIVTGQIVLDDPQSKTTRLIHLTVGLVHPDGGTNRFRGGGGGRFGGGGDDASRSNSVSTSGSNGVVSTNSVSGGGTNGIGGGRGGRFGGRGGRGGGGGRSANDAIHDGTYYQFWADGSANGKFTIPNVRPGKYTLHAFADGVLGDFLQTNITVEAGKTLDLGKLDWKPVRYGKQLWDIGYPDRTGGKFFKGDGANYWLWGWNLRYALLFPNDITYTIGKSDYRKDWFFEEVPHATNLSFVNPAAKDPVNQRFGWVRGESLEQYPQSNQHGPWDIYGRGRTTVWTVKFNMKKAVQGQAALRVALAGVNGIGQLPVTVNGRDAGAIGDGRSPDNARLLTTNTIRYNSDKGLWQNRTLRFNAALLKPGVNEMTFTVPGGDLQSGVVWDYLRLELDEKH